MSDTKGLAPSPANADERGATAVEYAFLVTLIAIVMIAGVALIGQELLTLFNAAAAAF